MGRIGSDPSHEYFKIDYLVNVKGLGLKYINHDERAVAAFG